MGGSVSSSKVPYGDQSNVYHLNGPKGEFFLKIGTGLEKERERLDWLRGKLPVPEVIGFNKIGDKEALILSAIEGENLAKLKKIWPAEMVISGLVSVLRRFHAVDVKNCPFGAPGPGKVLVHGDACLPNFVFKDGTFSGYIDLGDMRVDYPAADLSAAVWSLRHNLGPGHEINFLNRYGIKNTDEALVDKLISQYESAQKEWGLI